MQGILVVDKPEGFTSFDVVAKLRGICGTRRIGHGGTLDPMATGVLPVFVGGAAKAVDMQERADKMYTATMLLGRRTDTGDVTGETLEQAAVPADIGLDAVAAVLPRFTGTQQQVPPMYSAVKVNGQPLYKAARAGKTVERTPRPVTLHSIMLAGSPAPNEYILNIHCSKGTYVRTIVHDFGEALGTLAVMHSLVRTRSGTYPLAETVGFAGVERAMQDGGISALLRPTDSLFLEHPAVRLTGEGAERAARGAVVFPRMARGLPETEGTLVRVYEGDRFRMLGQVRALDKGGMGLFVYKNFR